MEPETQNRPPNSFEQYPHKEVLSKAIQKDIQGAQEMRQIERDNNDSPVSNIIPLHSRARKTEMTRSDIGPQDQDPGPLAS